MTIRSLTAAWALALLAGAAAADVVETKDGRKIEGKVIEETPAVVKIRTKFGVVEVARGDVKNIVKSETPDEAFEKRRAASKTAADFFELSGWCTQKGMRKEARECLVAAVKLDPKHDGANRALGHVKDGDEWVTIEERRRREAAREREALTAKGLVEHEGQWVTPEDKAALEKGLVKVGDKWLTKDEAQRAKGLALHEGKWIPATEAFALVHTGAVEKAAGGPAWVRQSTKNVAVAGTVSKETADLTAASCEKAFAALDRWFGGDGTGTAATKGVAKPYWKEPPVPKELLTAIEKTPPPVEILTFDADEDYGKAVDLTYAESRDELASAWPESVKRSFGSFVVHPVGRSIVVARGRDKAAVAGHQAHNVGHVVAHRYLDTPSYLPPWYDEALAVLAEDAATGSITMFCSVKAVSGTRTNDPTGPKAGLTGWRDKLRDARKAGTLQSLTYITEHDLFDLTTEDLLKAASVVEYLASRGDGSLSRLHGALQEKYGYDRLPQDCRERQQKAFQAAVKTDARGLEALWDRWIAGAK
jgi:hypothetical protein